jgi:fatty-acyl-CoA synthase
VITGYGSSEGGITLLPSRRVGALGRAPEGADVAVVDPDTGEEKAVAEFDEHGRLVNAEAAVGELVRRDSLGQFEGYWRNDEADRDRVHSVAGQPGWFWSGDLAYRDADGVFYFAGRAGDWLRVDSENFAAAPIEAILSRHPEVVMAAVYATPDPRTGDEVMCALELRPGAAFDAAQFGDFLAAQPDLGTKWAPRFVRIVETMPLTATNKVNKAPLRSEGWNLGESLWWRPASALAYEPFTRVERDAYRASFASHGRSHLLPSA